jgi:hypothetical protein
MLRCGVKVSLKKCYKVEVGLIPGSITEKIVENKMSIPFEKEKKNASHMLWQTNQKG